MDHFLNPLGSWAPHASLILLGLLYGVALTACLGDRPPLAYVLLKFATKLTVLYVTLDWALSRVPNGVLVAMLVTYYLALLRLPGSAFTASRARNQEKRPPTG